MDNKGSIKGIKIIHEPDIIINGIECSQAEAMTLRVALGSFIMSLRADGLGEDDIGKSITEGYLLNADKLQRYMLKGIDE